MLKKIAFTMVPVADATRARAFYEGTLGLLRGSASSNGMWTEYDLPGGGCLALFARGDAKPGDGGAMVAFEVEDLDGLRTRLRDEGVTFRQEHIESPVCRMTVIADSEGNSLMLHQLKPKH